MNTIPSELIAIPSFHGYYWHPSEQVVYSMKVDGILRPLKPVKEWRVGHITLPAGFNLSRGGKKYRMSYGRLRNLPRQDYEVPYKHEVRSRF